MQSFNNLNSYSRNKLIVIAVSVVLFIVTSPLLIVFGENNSVAQLINLLSAIFLNSLVFAWCYYDSLERNQSFGRGWKLAIVLFGVFALIVYLLKFRGFKHGLITLGKALLILLVMIIGSIIINTAILIILETSS